MKIEYIEKTKRDIDIIAPLWQKLLDFHISLSEHFAEHFHQRTWLARKAELMNKSKRGHLRIDIAIDTDTRENIGYCISTVSKVGHGELDSIYIESEYRKCGVGDRLMKRALTWMDEKHARTKILIVGAGNEQVFSFYSRYGFFPRSIVLEQVKDI
jgi:ribosomal protein S18 acetylase RimI-like enzyme